MQQVHQHEGMKVQFLPVGRDRREWVWKTRDDGNTITISGRFDSLSDAVRDARTQFDGLVSDDDPDGDDSYAA